ncbi:MAG: hypothetical protein ACK4J2_04555 [Sulfurihydrogenibium azorense]|uniref:hypothetical protein n=1 Tax=Sulfurihydrogenibium azorense TaxID=309806 RepID=UPI00391A485B
MPPGVTINLPKNSKIKAEWVVPSSSIEVKTKDEIIFDIDLKGNPWIGIDGIYLFNPLKRTIFSVSSPIKDFAFLETGEFVVATGEALGYLLPSESSSKLKFLPILNLPSGSPKLFPGEGLTLYISIWREKDKLTEVYRLREEKGKPIAEKFLTIKNKVNDICEGQSGIYIAIEKGIFKIVPDEITPIQPIFRHKEEIKEIECDSKKGIFYVTINRIGYLDSQKSFDFGHVPNVEIKVKEDSLFIFFTKTMGVIKIKGVENFSKSFSEDYKTLKNEDNNEN